MRSKLAAIVLLIVTFSLTLSAYAQASRDSCEPRNDWPMVVVQRGDTLFAIARSHDATVPELVAANCLANPNQITVGQLIRVPTLMTQAQEARLRADGLVIAPEGDVPDEGACYVVARSGRVPIHDMFDTSRIIAVLETHVIRTGYHSTRYTIEFIGVDGTTQYGWVAANQVDLAGTCEFLPEPRVWSAESRRPVIGEAEPYFEGNHTCWVQTLETSTIHDDTESEAFLAYFVSNQYLPVVAVTDTHYQVAASPAQTGWLNRTATRLVGDCSAFGLDAELYLPESTSEILPTPVPATLTNPLIPLASPTPILPPQSATDVHVPTARIVSMSITPQEATVNDTIVIGWTQENVTRFAVELTVMNADGSLGGTRELTQIENPASTGTFTIRVSDISTTGGRFWLNLTPLDVPDGWAGSGYSMWLTIQADAAQGGNSGVQAWSVTSTLTHDSCGGAGPGATFPVTLYFDDNGTLYQLTHANNAALSFPVRLAGTHSGYIGSVTLNGEATYIIDLFFSDANHFRAFLSVSFASTPGCSWGFEWNGAKSS